MLKAQSFVAARFPHMIFLPCMAHIINLVVGVVYKEFISTVIDDIQEVANSIRTDPFKEIFEQECMKKDHRPRWIRAIAPTRWNSAHTALASALSIKKELIAASTEYNKRYENNVYKGNKNKIKKKLMRLNAIWFQNVQRAEQLLLPFSIASKRMQKDSANLSDAMLSFFEMYICIERMTSRYKKRVLNEIAFRWHILEQPLYILGYALSYDGYPVMKTFFENNSHIRQAMLQAAEEYYCKKLFKRKTNKDLICITKSVDLFKKNWNEMFPVNQGEGCVEDNSMKVEILLEAENESIFMAQFPKLFLELSDLAFFLSKLLVHGAGVERQFSAYGNIKTKKRGALLEENMRTYGKISNFLKSDLADTLLDLPVSNVFDEDKRKEAKRKQRVLRATVTSTGSESTGGILNLPAELGFL